ncbi:dTDP-4-dehydrorhamnose 3,5-epimerase [Phyllobacterium myrsinacearum]|uniref:dTDP-4-dehydrorhamnose 3,5-epimerase n=1 Tax=Phyllobacterium myrsinacearum TaxID=28101 RepID=UPI00102A5B4D|nr:dTDP-4-dehydrorhamnose 3,5-epimerase [Phyllobacterium myrsinacearum]RZS79355.1 dTDP-4-dehydrorhamnose 3,5-epimerase [Phyllobacterium myrsinacearum]
MRFTETELSGAWLVETLPHHDARGSFARTFCTQEFREHGLAAEFVQHSASHSLTMHTVRGMHFQKAPHAEVKLVSCIRGAVWDVIIDLRPDSRSYRRYAGFELSEGNHRQLYIPKGFAHGFQTLSNDAVVSYLISEFYHPAAADGVRFDDPAFAIDWPAPPAVLSEKDRSWPLLGAQFCS